ncbi:cyclopropane-fatty-acyl-phospholipid synthase [Saccharothrix carnea]|uniref:Cyclopropane-fatty-acyl-phospholipid synthase n=1 Tax=Saccharothrix carnea TaxID=1280637 RepID=A0A2P8IJE7_SACCR|nr:cyclopropane-fatty-acyl-phospholipid synthase family protein [Saccharothrix carnea]PSL58571.1 cyclopropane-fatty-acyl-phospholipid synthase [Saccharothrix carnea]
MRLAEVFQRAVGGGASVRFSAYDGSHAGPADAGVSIEVRTPEALSYLASAPGELGLARAYVTGHLEIIGDVYGALKQLSEISLRELPWGERVELLATLGRTRLGTKIEVPPQERRLRGLRHSKARDREAIAHHYDVSNTFYEWVLGPSMAYTCAVYPTAESTLEEAQFAKHDLVARKLGLKPGMRLLDVGCGWGGMVMHAAREYGVKALGVTLSRNQAEWAQKAIVEAGLSDLAEVRYLDYRDVRETGFDAVSSIGLTEHIGKAKLPAYFRSLYGKLKPGGRMLNHCITRPDNKQPARTGGFIDRYVFPDGELVGPGHLVSLMHDTGFEVRHEENLREHYAMTLAAWCENLEKHWDDAVSEVGLGRARVWRLYLAASRLGFERNNIQLHQVLGVKLDGTTSHMPLRPDWLG